MRSLRTGPVFGGSGRNVSYELSPDQSFELIDRCDEGVTALFYFHLMAFSPHCKQALHSEIGIMADQGPVYDPLGWLKLGQVNVPLSPRPPLKMLPRFVGQTKVG